jgi:hypothetical protein
MGQQQLLLIVLGVIIVGIAVILGLRLFDANDRIAHTDKLTVIMSDYGNFVMNYFKKPKSFGGGGHSFLGWTPPKLGSDDEWTNTTAPGEESSSGRWESTDDIDNIRMFVIIYDDRVWIEAADYTYKGKVRTLRGTRVMPSCIVQIKITANLGHSQYGTPLNSFTFTTWVLNDGDPSPTGVIGSY